SSAQGLFMLMTNGIGATIGTLSAQLVVNKNVFSHLRGLAPGARETMTAAAKEALAMDIWHGWQTSWYIFAGYALVVAVTFIFAFRYNK
ncbi:MAG: hypothetical protein J5799_00915, partial [Bacteroidales bacterium]|nr:hypothetical protein [Bacteroidales bacterium]